MKLRIITLIAIAGMFSVSQAANSNAGSTAYSFLKIGVGAKSQAMAGAYVGLADDITSLHSNPAGLVAPVYDLRTPSDFYYEGESDYEQIPLKQIEFKQNRFIATYISYLVDFQSGFLGYARKLNDRSSLGISLQYLDYGSFDRLDESGVPLGTFSSYDMALGVTFAKRINRELSLGITGKFILEKIDSLSSDAMALDIGALYRFDDGRTSLGVAIRNFGSQLNGMTDSHKDNLPFLADVGMSHSLRGLPLTIDADLSIPADNNVFFAIGGQFEAFDPFFLRVGWTSMGQDYKTGANNDSFGGFAGGFGYKYQDYAIDYSYSSYADIGNVHRVSFSVEF